MRESIYNQYLYTGEHVLLYNHFTGSIGKISAPDEFRELLADVKAGLEPHNKPLYSQLIQDGFFVDDSIDEKLIGEMRYNDIIYSSRLNITILASEQCNFRCSYCYENFERGNITGEVVDSFLFFLRKNIYKYTRLSIDWFGGEPLLAYNEIEKTSKEAMAICQASGRLYSAGMTTNGYLLTADMLQRMLKCRITNFQVTLDGFADTHNQTRPLAGGGPTFDRTITNLRDIRDNCKSRLFKMVIRTNLSKLQLPRLDEFIAFLADEFGSDDRFTFFFRPMGDWGGNRVKEMRGNFISSFEELYGPLLNNDRSLNLDTYVAQLRDSLCESANRNSFILGSDGTVYKCTMNLAEDFNRIGHLDAKGILALDQNKLAQWVTMPSKPADECTACAAWSLCHNRACPAKAFRPAAGGKPNCGYEKKSVDFILKLLDKAGSSYVKAYR